MNFLEFEKPIAELIEELEKVKKTGEKTKADVSSLVAELEGKITTRRKEIFHALTPWQRVQISRHPDRPYTLAYIAAITDNSFIELHGDQNRERRQSHGRWIRAVWTDKRLCLSDNRKVSIQKCASTAILACLNPEGYRRKALRLMKLAEKFNKPVITLIDTPGAYPGEEAEQRGQGEAIARNLMEMARLKVPVICIIIGEGASGGGALWNRCWR